MGERLKKAVLDAIHSPFERPEWPGLDQARLAKRGAAAIARWLDAGETADAERLVLAIAHVQACDAPEEPARVLPASTLSRAVERRLPRPRKDYVRIAMAAARCRKRLLSFAGRSAALAQLRQETWRACFGDTLMHALKLERVIRDHDVVIVGETGAGKEAIAEAIQLGTPGGPTGQRAPHAAVNAAAIPDTLLESELFGHVKGAFTGAHDTRRGAIRTADGGCFFLDEVGDLGLVTQAKLLRVIETDIVQPLGSDEAFPVALRYVAATHRDLQGEVHAGRFRADLLHRLAGNVIHVPPLRDRPEDILDIGSAIARAYLDPDTFAEVEPRLIRWLGRPALQDHPFPGNVRELMNLLRDFLLGLDATPGPRWTEQDHASSAAIPPAVGEGMLSMRSLRSWYVAHVLAKCEGNLTEAARRLGVDRTTVRRMTRSTD